MTVLGKKENIIVEDPEFSPRFPSFHCAADTGSRELRDAGIASFEAGGDSEVGRVPFPRVGQIRFMY